MSFFDYLFAAVMIMTMPRDDTARTVDRSKTLFSFESEENVRRWYPINDGVMGGVSAGRVEHTPDGALRFAGTVSLENNGGFASARSRPVELDLSGYTGILIRVRGDGQRYAFNVQTDVELRAGSYRCKFATTPEEWVELYFPFAEFRATSFGAEVENAPPLNTARIRSLGLLISDKQAGPFVLDVDWIRAVATPAGP